uniref:Uncharacterized protein n=1 Tax=Globisporangium ultimum (strain ATCC 200006 / CBS 805.95 / DAOM BR144) TaxID=431595 RepID=K3X6V7_GLOUD
MTSKRGLFSPSSRLRRRSNPAAVAGISSSSNGAKCIPASPSSAQWSKRETAQLVRAWHDIVNDTSAVQETVDAFQTRLLLRFKEICDEEAGEKNEVRVVRTLTSVALKTYALRRMARFITQYNTQQQQANQSEDGDEAMAENWFSFSKNEQIERFQEAGATNFIELDEDTYDIIERILEKQERVKQQTPPPVYSGGHSSAWTGDEIGNVMQAWRDVFKDDPEKLPHTSAIYARFIALNGENVQRTKPEVASKKLALMNMYTVIAGFNNESTMDSATKITRGSMKRQRRQNWFSLSPSEREHVFLDAVGSKKEYCFMDIDEEMYAALEKLMKATEKIQDAAKRRFEKKRRSTDLLLISNSSEPIDLVSDEDDDEDDEDESDAQSRIFSQEQSQYHGYSPTEESTPFDQKSLMSMDLDEEKEAGTIDTQPQKEPGTDSSNRSPTNNQTMTSSSDDEREAFDDSTTNESSTSVETANDESECELEGVASMGSALKKQKLDAEVFAMVNLIEKQAEHLSGLVHQLQDERTQDQEAWLKALRAIAEDQRERQRVLEQLKAEREERLQDRKQCRQLMEMLMREKEERSKSNAQEDMTIKKEMKAE